MVDPQQEEQHDGPYIQGTILVFTDGPKERAMHSIDQFCRGLKQQVEDHYAQREQPPAPPE